MAPRTFIPDEKRSYSLHFFVLMLVLSAVTLWALVDEIWIRRPWKEHQAQYFAAEQERIGAQVTEIQTELAEGGANASEHQALLGKISGLERTIAAQSLKVREDAVEEALTRLRLEHLSVTREHQFSKSEWEAAFYDFRHALHVGNDAAADYRQTMQELQARVDAAAKEIERVEGEIATKEKELPKEIGELAAARTELTNFRRPLANAERRLARVTGRFPEIQQIVVPGFSRNEFRQVVDRVDRCTSCHLGILDEASDRDSGLFRAHPKRMVQIPGQSGEKDALLGIHPATKFGCTSCHQGQGIATTAEDAHGWHELGTEPIHYWDQPMLLGNMVEASCNQCHSDRQFLVGADHLNEAKELFRYLGCFGCHQVEGYEDFPKIGPDLRRVAGKINPEWLVRWIENPRAIHATARMPVFGVDRQQATQVAAYLLDASDPFEPIGPAPSLHGDATRGKEIVESRGCAGCHTIDEQPPKTGNRRFDFAPALMDLSEKVVSSAWIYDWVKSPTRYSPTTRMPNLRLSDAEAADVATYLAAGTQPSAPPAALAAALKSADNIKEGERLIGDLGCFGCHEIKGFEKTGRSAPPLDGFGTKEPYELDFGDTLNADYSGPEVHETWGSWVTNKLENPRLYLTERIDMRMPDFQLTEAEITRLVTFLKSRVPVLVTEHYIAASTQLDKRLDQGLLLAEHFNCRGCHAFAGAQGDITARYEDAALAPPSLVGEGRKVRSDWLFRFIKSPHTLRPWLDIRMPTFATTDAEASTLVEYLYALSGERHLHSFVGPGDVLAEDLAIGREMFDRLQCLKCHSVSTASSGAGQAAGDLAPDLSMARERLRYDWVVDWLKDPQALQPETRMPTFFPLEDDDDPTSFSSPIPEFLDGDAVKQIELLAATIYSLDENPAGSR